MHRHEYDGDRLVRTVVEVEPEFDAEQYEIAVALGEHEASLNELGIPRDEAMSEFANPDNPERKWVYQGLEPARDFAVDAVEQAEKAKADEFKRIGIDMPGSLRFGVRRVDV